MLTVKLGSTGIVTNKNGFGALPVQRVSEEYAVCLLRSAYSGGITFFDTARDYSDSEKKLGLAFGGMRERVFIATKTSARTVEKFWADLNTSLALLKTNYIDIYQFHNPPFCPRPGDESGLYDAALEAKERGLIRHIGITNHRLPVALEAARSGLYETMQFPFSYLSGEAELELARVCESGGMGFLAMKALAGGLINNAAAAYAYLARFENILPIWGVQRMSELEEFISCQQSPPALTGELAELIERDRRELAGSFCRACGYCMPCPEGIIISQCARMSQLIRRAPTKVWFSPEWQSEMRKIESCRECGQCAARCPYSLDTPALLRANMKDYFEVLAENGQVQ